MGDWNYRIEQGLRYIDYGNKKTTQKRQALATKKLLKKEIHPNGWFKKAKEALIRFLEKHSQ